MTTKQFYLLSLIGITAIGGLVLLLLWRQIKGESKENRGALFIALALFSWTIVGVYKYYDPPMPSLIHAINDRILSAFSNLFLLISLPYFPNLFTQLKERFSFFRKPEQWVINVFIFFAIITVLFTLIDRNVENDNGKRVIIAIDSVISTLTMFAISYAIYKSIIRFWHDKIVKIFLLILFAFLISTQIILPLIAIFPETFKPYYLQALLILLLGLGFFNLISIAYFGMLGAEMSFLAKENQIHTEEKQVHFVPQKITIGYHEQRKQYFIKIVFASSLDPSDTKEVETVSAKLLQPFANWMLFCVAKKHDVQLNHSDLSTIKFRMVEFWNKEAAIKLSQDLLFNNNKGLFDLNIDSSQVQFTQLDFLKSKFIIRDSILKHEASFNHLLGSEMSAKVFSKNMKEDQLINLIYNFK